MTSQSMNVAALSPPYSFISPILVEIIENYYIENRDSNRTIQLQALQALSRESTTNAHSAFHQTAIRTEPNRPSPIQSPIEIWNARTPTRPVLLGKDLRSLTGVARTNFENIRLTDQFFRATFRIPPINTADLTIRSYINDPNAFNNAFYRPDTHSLHFGDVDARIFTPLIKNKEITTHELGHAVTDFSSALNYEFQSGALNESLSDVFAIMHKHRIENVKANSQDAKWLIGEGVVAYTSGRNQSLRSMSQPGRAYLNHPILESDPQFSHMRDYCNLPKENDNGGVHINSGIPNHAFYLAATGEGGYSWEKIGKIWYNTLISAEPTANFSEFASSTVGFARKLYGGNIENIVGQAWMSVGVDIPRRRPPPDERRQSSDESGSNLPYVAGGLVLAYGLYRLISGNRNEDDDE